MTTTNFVIRNTTLAVFAALAAAAFSFAAPIVTMTEFNNVIRVSTQGAGTYKVLDFYLTLSPGAEYLNHRITVTALTGSLFDPSMQQVDREQGEGAGFSNTLGPIDTYANTVMSAAAKEIGGYTATIVPNGLSYSPTGSGVAPAFTFLDWSVSDSVTGDDNDLNDFPMSGGGPFDRTAPYRIARILATNGVFGSGTVQIQAFETTSGGVPTTFDFEYGIVPEPSSVLLCLAGIFATLTRRDRRNC